MQDRNLASGGVKCLDCDTVVNPIMSWEQCKCGHVYVDASGETKKVGFLDEDRVEYADGQELGPKKRVKRTGDKFTDTKMTEGESK
jgi:hypothetical protein